MAVKAICTDIDGTLLDSRRELSDRTIAAIKKVSSKIPIILASSRMPSAMTHLQKQLAILHYPLIAYNGGYVIYYAEGSVNPQVFESVFIPADVCAEMLSLIEKTSIHASLYFEDNWYAPAMDYWAEREEKITKVEPVIKDPNKVVEGWMATNSGAHKVMFMGPEEEMNVLEKQLGEQLGNHLNIYRSRPTYLEIAAKQISKGTALELLLRKMYGLKPEDAMSFGDNYNDIDLLKISGLGIAVSNAREEVKAIAGEITLKSIDDGVAVAIEKYC